MTLWREDFIPFPFLQFRELLIKILISIISGIRRDLTILELQL